jgi:hypothetical protein
MSGLAQAAFVTLALSAATLAVAQSGVSPPAAKDTLQATVATVAADGSPIPPGQVGAESPAVPVGPPGSFLHPATSLNGSAPPKLDGVLDDPAWQLASPIENFIQRDPDEGQPASERTSARILYDDDALYVGIQAFDSEPGKIVGLLTRRDESSQSDWLTVSLDSFGDRRTAFEFQVNPAGVERDIYRYDDINEDTSWDAVWDVSTRVDGVGWAAEFRIPMSQLRFASERERPWGLQISRDIVRRNEFDLWKPIAKNQDRWVSEYGDLSGLEQVSPPRRLELLPYTVGGGESIPVDPDDRFADGTDAITRMGLDLKYGITSDMTLDATFNPDFGQVEADPSVIDLSEFESFFPEKRPFFLEGIDKFQYDLALGDGNAESLFYTRRIGRAPQGDADGYDVDEPTYTTILGAGKVSGKTSNGWTVGGIEAVTQEEAAVIRDEDGTSSEEVVEPLSSYAVGRIARDFRAGETAVGGLFTATNRRLDGTDLDFLHSSAYTGGVDVRHRFNSKGWSLNGKAAYSYVQGDPAALLRTQRSSRRYYQRPDANHTEVDSSATSLAGNFFGLETGKFAGTWRGALMSQARSPGLETNDLGFQLRADDVLNALWFGYRDFTPGKALRQLSLNWNLSYRTNYGGEHLGVGGNMNGNAKLLNYWNVWGGYSRDDVGVHTTALRGGPAMYRPGGHQVWAGFNTDDRKRIWVSSDGWVFNQAEGLTKSYGGNVLMTCRVASNVNFSLGPAIDYLHDDWVYVTEDFALGEAQYVMARLHQPTYELTGRVNWTFKPSLSLQVYAAPFFSTGDYDDFKLVVKPHADRYADMFDHLGPEGSKRLNVDDGTYEADVNADGTADFTFDDPDFNFQQFRSSIVLRWEYMAGSTIFFVYQHDRTNETGNGIAQPWHDLGQLADTEGTNTVLVKVNYWWSL